MRGARDIDEHAIRRIGCHQRRIFDAPEREPKQRRFVVLGRGIDHG